MSRRTYTLAVLLANLVLIDALILSLLIGAHPSPAVVDGLERTTFVLAFIATLTVAAALLHSAREDNTK
jgi:hypothetical protein